MCRRSRSFGAVCPGRGRVGLSVPGEVPSGSCWAPLLRGGPGCRLPPPLTQRRPRQGRTGSRSWAATPLWRCRMHSAPGDQWLLLKAAGGQADSSSSRRLGPRPEPAGPSASGRADPDPDPGPRPDTRPRRGRTPALAAALTALHALPASRMPFPAAPSAQLPLPPRGPSQAALPSDPPFLHGFPLLRPVLLRFKFSMGFVGLNEFMTGSWCIVSVQSP